MSPAVSRRVVVAGSGAAALGLLGGARSLHRARHAEIPLYSETVAFTAPALRELVPVGRTDILVPRTRVVDAGPWRNRLVEDEEEWLAGCAAWTRRGVDDDGLLHSALLDLRALTAGLPVAVAGWSSRWRYAWPRDAAFVASALARVGRAEDAAGQLAFLASVQGDDGGFEARYDVATKKAPDGRVAQLDGSGWVLWAADELARFAPEDAGEALGPLRTMLIRCTRRLLTSRESGTGLPHPSSDYWELVERELTLGTAAAVLAGLRSADRVLRVVGEMAMADRAGRAAEALAGSLRTHFSPDGYPRLLGGSAPDAAVTFLVAPIGDPRPDLDVLVALDRAQLAMARPAGGVAPGASWKEDGISWTPETALFAAAWAATGYPGKAQELLGWLGAHRTAAGSFPEKVLHDGRPAAVAPLAWTAALVVIARHELDRR
ncbi:hypothetical protein JQN72_14565 [Phycicoccus sp. CSK15P-2]|uniref:hypothetical protein n=1 Tax=Phycicoccus sp. CSK15P-2 TaxID=2807627 RepID=UPI0019506317|nr:hypothetical protein [Phycicoccus sp. CSK15P-2]MBM6405466.1 hypothetical protein [Phycicoccus sp. CSK15P-2]